jgi:HlyD family secretion protein
MKKFKIVMGVSAIVIVVAMVLLLMSGREEAQMPEFKTAAVQRGQILAVVTSTGTVNPLNTVKVGSQISGNIIELLVDYNSPVDKDQVIARIDDAVYRAQLDQAKAQLLLARTQLLEKQKDILAAHAKVDSATAQLDSARASLREIKLQYERIAKLRESKTVAQSAFDEILAKRDNARGTVEIARANILTAQAQLQRVQAQEKGARALIDERQAALTLAEVRLNYCTIQSPINGTVIERAVDVGQTVAASLQSPVLFTIAEDLKNMQLEVDVSEADIGQIEALQDVEFTVDAYTDKKFQAKVRQVRNSPTNIQNVVTYKVVADVDNEDGHLRPGMTANVSLIVAQKDDVLKVPNAALRFRPPGQVKEAKPAPRSIKERPIYVNTVKKVELNQKQADEFEIMIEAAGGKLKTMLQQAQSDEDKKLAFRSFYTQVFTRLSAILTQDQRLKLQALIQEFRAASSDRGKSRPAQVYTVDQDGIPKVMKIRIGVSNDTETEVLEGVLQDGDGVIVGLSSLTGMSGSKESTNPLMRILTGRRR